MSTGRRKWLTVEEVRSLYYGGSSTADEMPTSITESTFGQLTPVARHLFHQAKKRLGEHSIVAPDHLPQEAELRSLIEHIQEEQDEELTPRERESLVASLSEALERYDILTPLVNNPEVNDVIVRSFDDISAQVGRRNIQTDVRFPDRDAYFSFVEHLLKRAGKSCTSATPVVDATIEPHVRVCVTHDSFSPPGSGPMMTLRISRHRNVSRQMLEESALAPALLLDYLCAIIASASSTLLIAGEVGTGKTTLVKALAQAIGEQEAILIIEDTHEIELSRPFVRTLLTREANTEGAGIITPAQAIRTGMRMAMNRIILGEMRDAQAAEAFIDVCSSGHAGMSTIHARSAQDALLRLELFLARAQPGIGFETIRRQVSNAVSVVVHLGMDKSEQKRRILQIVEIGTSADGAIQISPIFSFDESRAIPTWRRSSGVTQFNSVIKAEGITLPKPGDLIELEQSIVSTKQRTTADKHSVRY